MLNRLFGSLFPAKAQGGNVHVVDPAEIKRWMEAGEVVLIDVREPDEHAAESIPGAVNMPLSTFDPAQLPAPSDKKLVLHCRSGARCGMAAEKAMAAGYTGEINRMAGGIFGWKAANGPTRQGG